MKIYLIYFIDKVKISEKHKFEITRNKDIIYYRHSESAATMKLTILNN